MSVNSVRFYTATDNSWITSRTSLWMVKVLGDLGGGVSVQPPDKEERPYGGDVKRSSSGRQALAMFPERMLAGNYRQTRLSRLDSRPEKYRR
eukprot:9121560-Heterocapsa_arctica.AAC.1